mmetsp:Transcript_18102/g.56746  ORF Transcript_18102/g.56746 Transcript_18102/m.56746 type:complete len:156 (-) Transcript_18102:275-742(-)
MSSYDDQVKAFLRRPAVRVTVAFPAANKLVFLQVRSTLSDLYRQVDAPKTVVQLYCEDGTGIPRTDEYVSHFMTRLMQKPWHVRPEVFLVLGLTAQLQPLRVLSRADPPPTTASWASSPSAPAGQPEIEPAEEPPESLSDCKTHRAGLAPAPAAA